MKKIYSNPSLAMVSHLKNLVENHGIDCLLKNQDLQSTVGHLPTTEIWPELWVLDDEDAESAVRLLQDALASEESNKWPWKCRWCGEQIEGQFTECWKCGGQK